MSEETKIDLLRDSDRDILEIIKANQTLNLITQNQEFQISFKGDHYSDFCQFYEIRCKNCSLTVGKYFVTKNKHLLLQESKIYLELDKLSVLNPK